MDVIISPHAIDRFRERTGCKRADDYIVKKLHEMLEKAEVAEFTHNKYAVKALFNHDFTPANYFMYNNWIFVVVDGEVRTIHNNEAKRWVPTGG